MRAFLMLWRRELSLLFRTPLGYALAAVFLFVSGATLALHLEGQAIDLRAVPGLLFNGLFFWIIVLATCAVLTMRLVAEERTQGTLDLLLTAPIHESTIVLAKYGGALAFFIILCLPVLGYPYILRTCGVSTVPIDPGPILGAGLILFMAGALFLAVGTLTSCMARSQALAGLSALALNSVIFFYGHMPQSRAVLPSPVAGWVLDPAHYVLHFAAGMVDTRPLAVFLAGTVVALFLAVQVLQWQRVRTFMSGINLVMGVGLLACLVIMGLFIARRHYVFADLTQAHLYTLSDKTFVVGRGLKEDVDIVALCRPGNPASPEIRRLLMLYSKMSRRLHVEFIDPDREPARVEALNLRAIKTGKELVAFRTAETAREILISDLTKEVQSLSGVGTGLSIHTRTALLNATEQRFTSLLEEVTLARKSTVYFLAGHDERDTGNYDPYRGYSIIARIIRMDHVDIKTLLLGAAGRIPEDCDALIIAGPRRRLSPDAVTAVSDYLRHNGRLLLLVDAGTATGLEGIMEDWGVRINHDRVLTRPLIPLVKKETPGGHGLGVRPEVGITHFNPHPITRSLDGVLVTFSQPRSLTSLNSASTNIVEHVDRPRVSVLALSDEESWIETDFEQNPPRFDPDIDRRGPTAVAMAIERGPTSGVDVEILPTRIVVVGDSEFAANGSVAGGNQDFFMGSLNWLLRREHLIGMAPRPAVPMELTLDRRHQLLTWGWLMVGIPGMCGLFSLLMLFAGRRT